MLKGNCNRLECGKEFQWVAPICRDVNDLYTVECPHCGGRHLVEDGEISSHVVGEKVPTEVLYQVFVVRKDVVHLCYDGLKMNLEVAKKNVDAGNESYPKYTYYMKPVLDGLA